MVKTRIHSSDKITDNGECRIVFILLRKRILYEFKAVLSLQLFTLEILDYISRFSFIKTQ